MHRRRRSERRDARRLPHGRLALSLPEERHRQGPGKTDPGDALAIAAATDGAVTGLRGGLPIRIGGVLLGGIGVGSGSGEQDETVARAALSAIGADTAGRTA